MMQIEYIAPFYRIEGGHLSDNRHASRLMDSPAAIFFRIQILGTRLIKNPEIIHLEGLGLIFPFGMLIFNGFGDILLRSQKKVFVA
jgi:hypothetical protein